MIEADGETEKQEDLAAEVAAGLNAVENPDSANAELPDTTPEYEEYAKTDWDKLIKRGVELADKAQRYLSRGDKQPLPPKEQKELDDIVKKTGISQEDLTPGSKSGFAPGSFPFLKFPKKAGKEGPNDEWQDTYDTHSTVEPGTGKPGEHYIGPIPNANMDVNPDDHFNRQKNRIKAREETAKADRMRKILHPDVPERGKESWRRSDWNMVVSNFDDKERKELEDALFADAKTGEEQAFVKNLFGKDMKDTDWGKAWGVGGSAINQLRFKLFQRMKLALEKIGYIKPDHVAKTIEKTRAAIARQNELAEMYNKAVEAAGAEKGKPGAIGFEIEKLNIKEKGVKETMLAMADSGIKKIKPVKQPQEGVLRDTIILKTVKGFAANPKVSQIDIDKFVRWMKAFSYNDTHSKINSKLTADERKEYEEVRKAVADKKATPEQKQRFKELIAKRKGMSLSTLTNGKEK